MITSIYTNRIRQGKDPSKDTGTDFSLPDEKDIPKKVYIRSDSKNKDLLKDFLIDSETKVLCVVGSRQNTQYGKEVTHLLISGLKNYNMVIISGLAYGIDSIAHQAALENNIPTIAFPGSGLEDSVLYPQAHVNLAHSIIESGMQNKNNGCLVSEFEPAESSQKNFFIKRNILMAALCDAVLVIESKKHSGTSITAKAALDFGKEVMVVPGSIFSEHTEGVHELLYAGASPVMCAEDIIEILKPEKLSEVEIDKTSNLTSDEKIILTHLDQPKTIDELIGLTKFPISKINVCITLLEINKKILHINGKIVKHLQKNTI